MVEQLNNHGGTVQHVMVEQWKSGTIMVEQWIILLSNKRTSNGGTVEQL